MNLGGLEATRQQGHAARVAEENQEQGDEVVLNFSLPDGSSKRLGYKAGTLVACVKLDIERQCGIPMAKQKLTVGGKPLIDPLSLCDCPGISAGRSADVAVAADP